MNNISSLPTFNINEIVRISNEFPNNKFKGKEVRIRGIKDGIYSVITNEGKILLIAENYLEKDRAIFSPQKVRTVGRGGRRTRRGKKLNKKRRTRKH